MSCLCFPSEISDYVVDFLHDDLKTLHECCLVSKSWVPRARKYIFGEVRFGDRAHIWKWRETFPDRANSPACYTHSLHIECPEIFDTTAAEDCGLSQSFYNVVRLKVRSAGILSPWKVVNLVCSLPLLKDLEIKGGAVDFLDEHHAFWPVTPLPPTGTTLTLSLRTEIRRAVERLLDASNGLYLHKFVCTWCLEDDPQWITALVGKCAEALECVDFWPSLPHNLPAASIDFSEARRLKEVKLRTDESAIAWVAAALRTVGNEDLRRVSIYIHCSPNPLPVVSPRHPLGEAFRRKWTDLDNALAQLWESHAARVKIELVYVSARIGEVSREVIESLLPEMMKREIELVNVTPSNLF